MTPAAVPRWIATGEWTSQPLPPLAGPSLSTSLATRKLVIIGCPWPVLHSLVCAPILESKVHKDTNVHGHAKSAHIVCVPACNSACRTVTCHCQAIILANNKAYFQTAGWCSTTVKKSWWPFPYTTTLAAASSQSRRCRLEHSWLMAVWCSEESHPD